MYVQVTRGLVEKMVKPLKLQPKSGLPSRWHLQFKSKLLSTVVHDFNGHEVNGIHGHYGSKGYNEALYSVNKKPDFTGIHGINGKFPYYDIFR